MPLADPGVKKGRGEDGTVLLIGAVHGVDPGLQAQGGAFGVFRLLYYGGIK